MGLDTVQGDDLLDLVCGEKLGEGAFRTTFVSLANNQRVVKLDNQRNFSNIAEWDMWNAFSDTPLGKWLAPCYAISPRGIWLIQARTEPLPASMLPDKIPEIFNDIKPSNWGLFEGRPVCHDYGNHRVYTIAGKSGRKLMKADWSRG